MSSIADTIANVRRVTEILLAAADPAATRLAQALDHWVAGEDFDAALELPPSWRSHLRLTARNRTLDALVTMHSSMNDSELAAWIVKGLARVRDSESAVRPDGAEGHLWDLDRAECVLSRRQWRRLIVGHRGSRMAKPIALPSLPKTRGRKLGTKKSAG